MPVRASTDQLLADLDRIDSEGWDGPTGRSLLEYVRVHLVAPQVAATGLCGPAAAQAEASGWEAAWQAMSRPYLRTVARPWSVLWVAIRRAVRGEVVAGWFVTGERSAWRCSPAGSLSDSELAHVSRLPTPASLDELSARGRDVQVDAAEPPQLGDRLEAIVTALAAVGWDRRQSWLVVEGVAMTAVRDGKAATDLPGWRPLAARLGVAPWRVRRVMALLCGSPGWPGLLERMIVGGRAVLGDPGVRAALASTTTRRLPPPAKAAAQASSPAGPVGIRVAS